MRAPVTRSGVPPRRGVVVLGMHRGGTSATAGALARLGLSPGDPSTLKGASPVNPAGFWEQPPLTRFNDRLFERLGAAWDAPPRLLKPGWTDALGDTREEAFRTFKAVFPRDPWVWKDPRNCILLPYWIDALSLRPAIVLVIRNPMDIAASLAARERATAPFAIALWERYTRHALAACAGLFVLVTRYSELLADPLGWAERCRAALTSAGLELGDGDPRAVADFIDPGLRHHETTDDRLPDEPYISDTHRDLLDATLRLVGTHESFVPPTLGEETPSTEWLLAERRRAVDEQRALRQDRPRGKRARAATPPAPSATKEAGPGAPSTTSNARGVLARVRAWLGTR